jgi:hypothetical protein
MLHVTSGQHSWVIWTLLLCFPTLLCESFRQITTHTVSNLGGILTVTRAAFTAFFLQYGSSDRCAAQIDDMTPMDRTNTNHRVSVHGSALVSTVKASQRNGNGRAMVHAHWLAS